MPRAAPDADILALTEALRPVLLRVSRRLRQESQKEGLSPQDALLLGYVSRNPGVGVCELADLEQIARPTMSAQVKRLEAAGFLARREDEADGRRSGLWITPAGRRQVEAVRRRRNDWLAARLTALAPAERERLADAAGPLLALASPES